MAVRQEHLTKSIFTPRNTTEDQTPVLSAEIFIIPLEADRYLIYAPLRRAAFVGNARVVNFLADLKSGTFDKGADPDGALTELLRQLEILEAGPESLPVTEYSGEPQPTAVTLFMTTACNLRCTYCYASAGDKPATFMTMDVAKRGIDFVATNAVKRGLSSFEVLYHGGGETTVNWKVMTESVSYARQTAERLGLSVNTAAATNGVLTNDQIDWIVSHLDGVSLSFDGLPEAHDRHRLTILGQGSSTQVMHTMRRFDHANFPYGVRVTVTADQITRLPESIDFICAQFKPTHIQVEPSYQLGRWTEAPSAETAEFITAYRAAQVRARRSGKEISFSAARVGALTNHFCGISQDSFALTPDGNVSACYEAFSEDNPLASVFFYGQSDRETNSFRFQLPVLNNLRQQSVQHRDYCQGCFAKWTCAGDCYHKSIAVNGSEMFSGSERCHITRELTTDQILDKIAASGGLFWHEAPAADAPILAKEKEFLP